MLFLVFELGVALVIGIVIAIIVVKTVKKKKVERPLSLEEKIIVLNNQLSAGVITKEEYDAQKADLLKNI